MKKTLPKTRTFTAKKKQQQQQKNKTKKNSVHQIEKKSSNQKPFLS